MKVSYAARSHVGYLREENQDNLYAEGATLPPGAGRRPFAVDGSAAGPVLLAVCDGMGGEADGAAASRLAVEVLRRHSGPIKAARPEQLETAVQAYADEVNRALRQIPDGTSRRGTTLALLLAGQDGVRCFNMGDSRIYRLDRQGLIQVTWDHTAGPETDRGRSHRLTRCVGIGEETAVEHYPPFPGNCRVLLCSDGLTDMADSAAIERVLRQAQHPAQAADDLLCLALAGGGRDNVTVIVADLDGGRLSPALRRTITLKGQEDR